MYIIALLFTGTLRLSLNPGIFYLNLRMGEKKRRKNCGFYSLFILLCMAWSVACWNTPPRPLKAVCRITSFICTNTFECWKKKELLCCFCLSQSHTQCEQHVQFKLRERDVFLFLHGGHFCFCFCLELLWGWFRSHIGEFTSWLRWDAGLSGR